MPLNTQSESGSPYGFSSQLLVFLTLPVVEVGQA